MTTTTEAAVTAAAHARTADRTASRLTKLALTLLFATLLVGLGLHGAPAPQWWEILLLPLAVLRLGRSLAWDKVFDWLRWPVTMTVKGDVVPRGRGAREALGELISCPICAGTWAALALALAWAAAPAVFTWAVLVFGAAGGLELGNAIIEAQSWASVVSRKEAER